MEAAMTDAFSNIGEVWKERKGEQLHQQAIRSEAPRLSIKESLVALRGL
jgi:hypothetical protein